jgi:hypothetical protein
MELLHLSLSLAIIHYLLLWDDFELKIPLTFFSEFGALVPSSVTVWSLLYWLLVPKRYVGNSCIIEATTHTTWQCSNCWLPNCRFRASNETHQGRGSAWWGQDSKHHHCTDSLVSHFYSCSNLHICDLYPISPEDPITSPSLHGPLYTLGLDFWAKLKWNEALPGKFVTSWMRLLLFSLYYLCLFC